jgi:hypothetical protein
MHSVAQSVAQCHTVSHSVSQWCTPKLWNSYVTLCDTVFDTVCNTVRHCVRHYETLWHCVRHCVTLWDTVIHCVRQCATLCATMCDTVRHSLKSPWISWVASSCKILIKHWRGWPGGLINAIVETKQEFFAFHSTKVVHLHHDFAPQPCFARYPE